jgi:hypothetical protein
MKTVATCLVAGIAAAACGCTPHRSKQEKLEAHFAVGTNWPNAIQTLERVVGPAQLLGGKCATDLGTISFTKLQTGEYLVEYPTRGAGAPGNAMPRSPEAFASALGDAFTQSRCTHADFQYDQYAVAVDVPVDSAAIASVRVSRAQ